MNVSNAQPSTSVRRFSPASFSSTHETVALPAHLSADVDSFMAHGTKPAYVTKPKSERTSADKQAARIFKKAVASQTKANAIYAKIAKQAQAKGETVERVGANMYGISDPFDGCTDGKVCCLAGAAILCFPVAIPLACCFARAFPKTLY